jgi:Fe2+ transport system protein FeoA
LLILKNEKKIMTGKITKFKSGVKVKIKKIETAKRTTLNLRNLGIQEGYVVKIIRESKLKGPIIIDRDETEIALGYNLAQKITAESI